MANSVRRLCFRMVLLFTFLASLVLFNGVSSEETPSRQRRGFWEDTPTDNEDDQFFNGVRNPRMDSLSTTELATTEPATPEPATPEPATPEPVTPEPATPEPATPEPATPEPATPEPATPEPATPEPATSSTIATTPPQPAPNPNVTTSTPAPPAPPGTDPPPDNCGTTFVATIGLNDPGPCLKDPSAPACPSGMCMKDFSDAALYKCQWRSINPVGSNATSIMVDVPGHCDPTNPPNEFVDPSISREHRCIFSNSTTVPQLTKCVCTKWDGSCPEEPALKYCEAGMLQILADEMIKKIEEGSERVQQDCPADYELEEKLLPRAMEALKAGKNLYRTMTLLLEARNKHICNRRRLMTALPDGRCGCAPGTARRARQIGGTNYQSYFCYPIEGACDKDPGQVIEQFESTKTKLYLHYGDPTIDTHKNKTNGCYFNLCKNAEDVRGNTCQDVDFGY